MSSSGQTGAHHHECHDDCDQARDLERVTDYVEEPEIDVGSVSNVVSMFEQEERTRQSLEAAREREIRSVKIDKAHVKLIAEQMDLDADVAERVLKENGGDPSKAVKDLLHRRLLV